MFVCEDVHWADPASVAVIRVVMPLAAQLPVLVHRRAALGDRLGRLGAARPRPPGVRRRALRDPPASPSSEADSRALVANLLVIESLPDAASATSSWRAPKATPSSSRRSCGCSSSAGSSSGRTIAGWPRRASRASRSPTPSMACCSRASTSCPAEARRSLRVAAVIGRQFPLRVLERVLGADRPTGR